MSVQLHGYQYSVYAWIARLALREKGVAYHWVEVDPFAETVPEEYLALHPFKRVPVLVHDGFVVYETNAITRYIDEVFEGPALQPTDAMERARGNQVISIVDSYGYWPLVRQVFSHAVFRPRMGLPADDDKIRQGIVTAATAFAALEKIAGVGPYLCGDGLSLADIHLAPMIGYFVLAAEGNALLERHARLGAWWSAMSGRTAYRITMPRLPEPPR